MKTLHRHLTALEFQSPALLEEVMRVGVEKDFLVVRLGPQMVAVARPDLEALEQYLLRKGYYPTRRRRHGKAR
ncbi:MAG: hypothetical protein Q8P22_12685 [Chloroflexota bacterium]|nr:hypothetical protein [Chloroflexota bacterium]